MQEFEPQELNALINLVREKYNLDFQDYAISSFKRRITRILELYKFKSIEALINRLATNSAFFDEFVSEITVNVTEMFRDPTFWKALRDNILPNIFSANPNISIWHAGCSSGEEVFSMCILLQEMGYLDRARIVASDLDTAIIAKALKNQISLKHMEVNAKNYLALNSNKIELGFSVDTTKILENPLLSYFDVKDNMASLKKELLKNVSFRKHDLVQGGVFGKFDLVLCRNVMIYFNQQLQNTVLTKLHESIYKYGYLAIGSKESLIWCDISNKFLVVNNEEKIYKKIKD
jgi:chemotaxis protein methyltransferase CheR